MAIRSWMRSIERQWLRPLGRQLRLPRLGGGQSRRLAAVEQRVEELESLVRELTGLAYLQLDDAATDRTTANIQTAPREAALLPPARSLSTFGPPSSMATEASQPTPRASRLNWSAAPPATAGSCSTTPAGRFLPGPLN